MSLVIKLKQRGVVGAGQGQSRIGLALYCVTTTSGEAMTISSGNARLIHSHGGREANITGSREVSSPGKEGLSEFGGSMSTPDEGYPCSNFQDPIPSQTNTLALIANTL